MQATLSLQSPPASRRIKAKVCSAEKGASVEIHCYLAARDLLLRQSEADTTTANLLRAGAANDFAESCLGPARAPYQAQALPEAEAARERRRCQAIKLRLAKLRIRAGLPGRVA